MNFAKVDCESRTVVKGWNMARHATRPHFAVTYASNDINLSAAGFNNVNGEIDASLSIARIAERLGPHSHEYICILSVGRECVPV